jgi:hypothetical protein
MRRFVLSLAASAALLAAVAGPAAAGEPTCSAELGIEAHGQHIVGDYITGIGHENLEWSPSGGIVGQTIAGSGVVVAGGPGPGYHFQEGYAPGASFCIDWSASEGDHF